MMAEQGDSPGGADGDEPGETDDCRLEGAILDGAGLRRYTGAGRLCVNLLVFTTGRIARFFTTRG